MTDPTQLTLQRATWAGHTLAAMRKAKHCRFYATTPADQLALAALLYAWQKARDVSFTREDATEFLESLAPYCGSLFQVRPSDEPEPVNLDEFRDEYGHLPRNPWSPESRNVSDQNFVAKKFPALATYLKTVAEKGETYQAVLGRKADKEARQAMRDLEYGEAEHRQNPFCNPDTTLTARMAFEKAVGEPIAQFYKREAETPIQLPWLGKPNMTTMQRCKERLQIYALSLTALAKCCASGQRKN